MSFSKRTNSDHLSSTEMLTIKEIFKDVFLSDVNASKLDPVVFAELQLTYAEFERLLEKRGNEIVSFEGREKELDRLLLTEKGVSREKLTPWQLRSFIKAHREQLDKFDPMKPFRDFLANRWDRICNVTTSKPTAADNVVKAIANSSKEQIAEVKKDNQDAQAARLAAERKEYDSEIEEARKDREERKEDEQKRLAQAAKEPLEKTKLTPQQKEEKLANLLAKARAKAQEGELARYKIYEKLRLQQLEPTKKQLLEADKKSLANAVEQIKTTTKRVPVQDINERGVVESEYFPESPPPAPIDPAPIDRLRAKLRLQQIVRKVITLQPRGTDLIYLNAQNQPANIFCTHIATIIDEVDGNHKRSELLKSSHKEDKLDKTPRRKINSLLMPTVAAEYFFANGQYPKMISIDQLSTDKIILTDNGKDFIPVFFTMTLVAETATKTGMIEFKTAVLSGDSAERRVRLLTPEEQERLLSHSPAVREYHQAIQQSIVWKKRQERSMRPISIKTFLQHYVNGRYPALTLNDLFLYFDKIDPNVKNKLFAMTLFYVPHSGEPIESTFGNLAQYFINNPANYTDQCALQNLSRFLERNKFAFNDRPDLYVMPPAVEVTEDPLLLATPQFEQAMQQSSIDVTFTYGDAGRQRLTDQVYRTKSFPAVIKAMHDEKGIPDVKKIVAYLEAMPVQKITSFISNLPARTRENLLNNESVDITHILRVLHHLDWGDRLTNLFLKHVSTPERLIFILDNYGQDHVIVRKPQDEKDEIPKPDLSHEPDKKKTFAQSVSGWWRRAGRNTNDSNTEPLIPELDKRHGL